MSIIGITAKHTHPEAKELTNALITWIKKHNLDYKIDRQTVSSLGIQIPNENIISREMIAESCNPIVVLGGDGTLISVCRHPATTPPTIIGVNLGTLGFLTEITTKELFTTLELVLNGKAELEQRSLLSGCVIRKEKQVTQFHSINDVVITKQALARIFALELWIDEDLASIVRGDGMIIATPSGSTAYSMAAGGAIVHPQVKAILVTPICPHSLSSRPLVIPSKSKISLIVASDTSPNHVYLTIDGQSGMALEKEDSIEITTSQHFVNFAKSPSRNYFNVLATTLKWSNR
jgi:NAD+ kinase